MKNMIIFISGLVLLTFVTTGSNARKAENNPPQDQPMTLVCSPDLAGVAYQWAAEYGKLNPDVEIKVMDFRGEKIDNIFQSGINLAFLSDKYLENIDKSSLQKMVVGRDVIVPVMNSASPFRDEILQMGVSSRKFASIFLNPDNQKWGVMLGGIRDVPLHYYIAGDETINGAVVNFLGIDPVSHTGIPTLNTKEMISAIQKDPYAIGFCRIADVVDYANNAFVENIELMPVDKNGNGKMDYFEDIYTNPESFTRGVWIGKYPQELIGSIYSLAVDKPGAWQEKAFLRWVLTEGQPYLNANGYSDLASGEVRSNIGKLYEEKIVLENAGGNLAGLKVIILVLMVAIVIGIITEAIILFNRNRKTGAAENSNENPAAFNEDSLDLPRGLFFDKTHTWAFMQPDGKVKIGLDEFLPRVTGHLTGIKMKNSGERIKKGEVILSLTQKGKQLNIKSPVSGIILEQNKRVVNNASVINSAPYSDGWIYMIEPTNWLREIQLLFMADKFRKWLKNEFSRLKDFFAVTQGAYEPRYAHIVLQEGGELKEGILMDMGPEVWEDFQSHFIETTT